MGVLKTLIYGLQLCDKRKNYMDIQGYIEIRRKVSLDTVSLGYQTIELYQVDELKEAQLGYSVGASGEALIGDSGGAWKDSWLVVAKDGLMGEPFFVDLDEDRLPVYTASHGQGTWNPEMVAPTFQSFVQVLKEIEGIAKDRQDPVALKSNPLSDAERSSTLVRIAGTTDSISLEFWEIWFDV